VCCLRSPCSLITRNERQSLACSRPGLAMRFTYLWALQPGLPLHPFNCLFSRTTSVSRLHKGKPFWILMNQEMMGGSCINWTTCKSFAIGSRQIKTPVPHHSVFLRAGCPFCHRTNSVKAPKAAWIKRKLNYRTDYRVMRFCCAILI